MLDLEGRDYKDAMLHLYQLMNELSFDIIKFGGQLMSELKTVYEESDIIGFSEKMYDLWKLLPDKINNEEIKKEQIKKKQKSEKSVDR